MKIKKNMSCEFSHNCRTKEYSLGFNVILDMDRNIVSDNNPELSGNMFIFIIWFFRWRFSFSFLFGLKPNGMKMYSPK